MKQFPRTLALVIMTLAIVTSQAPRSSAQTPAPSLKPKLYLGGGAAALTNPSSFELIYASKRSLVAAVGLPFSVGIEVMAKFHYHTFGLEDTLQTLGATDPNLKFITYGLDAKWSLLPPPIPARPYVLVGLGQYLWKQDAVSVGPLITPKVSETDMYFNIGVGVDVGIGPNFALFAEIKHTILNQPGESLGILPIVVGVRIL